MSVVTFSPRTLVILALATTVACGGRRANLQPSPSAPDQTVEQVLAAANAGDLDRMANLWGTEQGSEAEVRRFSETDRLQRLTIMQRMLRSESHMVTATDATDPSKRVLTVAITQGSRRFAVPFTLVPSRAGGWLIREIGLDAAMPSSGQRP
jgi:hypothetical protein